MIISTIKEIINIFFSILSAFKNYNKLKINYSLKYYVHDTLDKLIEEPFIYIFLINSSSEILNLKGIFIETFNKTLIRKYNKKSIPLLVKSIKIAPKDSHEIKVELTELKLNYKTLLNEINNTKNKYYRISVIKYNNKKTYSKKIEKIKYLNTFITKHSKFKYHEKNSNYTIIYKHY